ncbi:hypothetical protein Tco_1513222, partial [Tanacetum coccineum]
MVVLLTKVSDEAVYKELGDRMEMAATTASSFKAEQDNGSGPRGYTLGSGEDSMQQMELMEFVQNCVTCSARLVLFSTASATPEVSTAAEGLIYIRRSAKKKKDKGKAIKIKDESVQKKSKKQMQEERLGHEEAIRLQEHIDEEERKRIAKDAKIFKKVHHVSSIRGQDIFMLVEKDYPLTKGLAVLKLSNKLRVDQQSNMADELLTKIYNIVNKTR